MKVFRVIKPHQVWAECATGRALQLEPTSSSKYRARSIF